MDREMMEAKLQIDTQEFEERIIQRVIHAVRPLLSGTGEVDPLLDVEGLSKYLNVQPGYVYQKIHDGTIPYIKLGKYPRFRKSKIDLWLLKMEKGNGKKQSVKNPTNSVRRLLD